MPGDGGGYPAAAARFEPPMRSFAPTDFEGDLDGPSSPDGSALPSAPPDGEPKGQPRSPAFLRLSQWGLKGGMGLLLGAFVVLYGGVTVLHRYDQPSVSPASGDEMTKSADGSIDSNLNGLANNAEGASTPASPVAGAAGSALSAATPPNVNAANAGVSPTQPTSRAGAASKHTGRGRAHGHARTHSHAYARRPHPRSRDTTYLHADVQLPHQSERLEQRDMSQAHAPYQPNAFRII